MNGFKQAITPLTTRWFLTHIFLWLGLVVIALPALATTSRSWDDVSSGTLFLRFNEDSTRWVAPTLDSNVNITVTGPIVRAVVKQRFHNPSEQWAEATYLFPLPENAAVDHMRMRIGERIIEGQIKEREEAKKIYQVAKRSGKRASLVEQERPNLFTTSVANIPPGEQITVEIEYQHAVHRDSVEYSLRYPMTVTPRYVPGSPIVDESGLVLQSGNGLAVDTDAVPDASRITPPWNIGTENTNPTRIKISLNPGFLLGKVVSPHHSVHMDVPSPLQSVVSLTERSHLSNSDFELRWQPEDQSVPQAAFFSEQYEGNQYSLLQITPPSLEPENNRLPRDVVFVIDTSGSMGGEPIRQAKESLLWALDRLKEQDRFNVVEFNSTTDSLFADVQQALPGTISRARSFVEGLESRGGTEMLKAAEAALCKEYRDEGRVRQVVFITDGAIGNEEQLFRLIRSELGSTRLFTVGIGSAPNSYFMTRAAEFGRGTFTYIADAHEVATKMADLYRKLEAPVLTDLTVQLPGSSAIEVTPSPIPDLYAGEPLIVQFTGANLPGEALVTGMAGEVEWRKTVMLSPSHHDGIHVLWARQKIKSLIDQRTHQRDLVHRDQLRTEALELALNHHLVSPFTSLVAVDVTPVRPEDQRQQSHSIANNAPKGTQFNPVQTATPALQNSLLALGLLLLALVLWRSGRSWSRSVPFVSSNATKAF